MNLSEVFPREAPPNVMPLNESEVWGPIVIDDPRVNALSLGSRLSIEENRVHWIKTDDFGQGFVFQGTPRVTEEGIFFTHASSHMEILIRPLTDTDWKYFGDGKTVMSLEEIQAAADAMFSLI